MNSEDLIKAAILYKIRDTATKIVSTIFRSDDASYQISYVDNRNTQKTISLTLLELIAIVATKQEYIQATISSLTNALYSSTCQAGEEV